MEKRLSMPDGLRVFAVGLIMSFHIWQQSWLTPAFAVGPVKVDLLPAVRTGYIMVDIMLMLSGFLLFLPVARGERLDIRKFYFRRFARVVPSYLLSVLVVLFAFVLPEGGYPTVKAMWKDIFTHLTFTHTFFSDTYISTKLNVVLWTLAIEMQFYLIFPFVARAFKKYPLPSYALMVTAAVAFRKFVAEGQSDIDMYLNQLPAMLDVYANGMMAALILAEIEKREKSFCEKLLFTGILMFAFWQVFRVISDQCTVSFPMEARKQGQLDNRFILSASGALILISGESSFLFIRCVFGNPVTRFLSGISYNAYIWHQILAVKCKEWKIPNYITDDPASAGEMPWQVRYTVLCFILALAVAAAVTYLFERPVSKKLTKITNRLH